MEGVDADAWVAAARALCLPPAARMARRVRLLLAVDALGHRQQARGPGLILEWTASGPLEEDERPSQHRCRNARFFAAPPKIANDSADHRAKERANPLLAEK